MTGFTNEQVQSMVAGAREAGYQAAMKYFKEQLGGRDQMCCGFAWVTVKEKASTKLGRALVAAGFRRAHGGGLQLWNPSGLMVQNVDTLARGAEAAAEFLTQTLGVAAYAGSRLD
jgi:hypothetical protein